MQRLKRVFPIDLERCPQCAGRGRIIASIEVPDVIHTILSHLAERDCGINHPRAPPPRAPDAQSPASESPGVMVVPVSPRSEISDGT